MQIVLQMKSMQNKIKLIILLALVLCAGIFYYKSQFIFYKESNSVGKVSWNNNDIPSIQLYFCIKKYCKEFSIPEEFGFAVAYAETGYRGPMHINYDHKQTSYAGALGPMQVMLSTAKFINKDESVSRNKLLSDIDYNVYTSIKLIRYLKNKYGDWKIVFGYYNTGYPIVNDYAMNVYNKKYTWKSDL